MAIVYFRLRGIAMGKPIPAEAHRPAHVMGGAIHLDLRVKPVKAGGDERNGRPVIGLRSAQIVLLFSALSFTACSGRIWQDEASVDTLRLHWYTAEASIDKARSLADEHCRRFERRAQMV